MSPSMRREWIEMMALVIASALGWSPSMRREWIEMMALVIASALGCGLPPCGGSGLKSGYTGSRKPTYQSPSMRREWIEI